MAVAACSHTSNNVDDMCPEEMRFSRRLPPATGRSHALRWHEEAMPRATKRDSYRQSARGWSRARRRRAAPATEERRRRRLCAIHEQSRALLRCGARHASCLFSLCHVITVRFCQMRGRERRLPHALSHTPKHEPSQFLSLPSMPQQAPASHGEHFVRLPDGHAMRHEVSS